MRQRFNRIVSGIALCLLLCFSGLVPSVPVAAANGIDNIPDPALRALIRETLNRPYGDIALPELVYVKRLHGEHRGIQDISGLQYLTNLSELDLSGNSISDLTPLAALYGATDGAKLRHVHLAENLITDITPLAEMTLLETLDLASNQITNITPFYHEHGLYGVTWLSLAGNQIDDVTGLAKLTELEFLALDQNRITDISPLVANRGLGLGDMIILLGNPLDENSRDNLIPELEARRAQVFWRPPAIITPVAPPAPPEVPVVFADVNLEAAVRRTLPDAGDIISAGELVTVTELRAAGQGISDLQGIQAMTSLTVLDLADNTISDIEPLYYLPGLEILDLSGNLITSTWYLLQNAGLDTGDTINLVGNPLAAVSLTDYIPQLVSRGVMLNYDPPPPQPEPEPEPEVIPPEPLPVPEMSPAIPTSQPDTTAGRFKPADPVKGLLGVLGGGLSAATCTWGIFLLRRSQFWKRIRQSNKSKP